MRQVARVPLDWILRELASRGVLQRGRGRRRSCALPARRRPAGARRRIHSRGAAAPRSGRAPVLRDRGCRGGALPRGAARRDDRGEGPLRPRAYRNVVGLLLQRPTFSTPSATRSARSRARARFPAEGGAILELAADWEAAQRRCCPAFKRRRARRASRPTGSPRSPIPFLRRGAEDASGRLPGVPFAFARCDMNRPFSRSGRGARVPTPSCTGSILLHVASDLAFTLREIRTAPHPSGTLVISECVRPFPRQPIYVEFIFNLLEAFREPGARSGVAAERWLSRRRSSGRRR